MAQVRLRVGLAGVAFAHCAGELYTCDDASAARLVAAGFAEWPTPPASTPLTPPPEPETMMRTAPERAVKPRGKGRG